MIVLDSSAILAAIRKETGWDKVTYHDDIVRRETLLTAANYCEILSVLQKDGLDLEKYKNITHEYVGTFYDIDNKIAELAAKYRLLTKQYGLSMGDRMCLACAKIMSLPVLTADKVWTKLDLDIDIQCIR